MPLINTGWMDRISKQYTYAVTLLGTSGTPEVAAQSVVGGQADAGWRFNAAGTTNRRQGTWGGNYDDWVDTLDPSPGVLYEIRATKQSGSESALDTGNLATWEALSATVTYALSNNLQDGTTEDIVLKIEVRDAATQTIQDTGYYKISVTSSASVPGPGVPGESTP